MKRISVAAATVALFAVTALGAAACGPDSSSNSTGGTPASSAPTVFPKEDLAKAIVALNATSEKFTVTHSGKAYGGGTLDVPNKSVDIALSSAQDGTTIKFEFLTVDTDVFVKYDFGTTLNKQFKLDPKKWLKIDVTKVTDASTLPSDTDPLGLQDVVHALSDVKTADNGATYTGTIDLDAASNSLIVVEGDDLKTKYGDKIKAVPFTATVADGKVTSFKIDGTGIGDDVTAELAFTSFGSAAVTKPTSFINAPSSIYEILNG